jgi:hypothetical protein
VPKNEEGTTLIETLIALAISLVLFLSFLAAVAPVQSLTWDLSALHDRDATLCLAPPLFYKWISGVGNNRANRAVCVRTGPQTLQLESDTDGSDGFPDGDVEDSYESITVRGKGSDLQLKIGAGSFQPVFRNIATFEAQVVDPQLIGLKIEGEVDKTLIRVPSAGPKPMSFDVYLWNFHPSLFEEVP